MDRRGSFAILALGVGAAAVGCAAGGGDGDGPEPAARLAPAPAQAQADPRRLAEAGTRVEQLADRAAQEALGELTRLHAEQITRRLRELPPERAAAAQRYFAERRAEPTRLGLRYTAQGTPRSLEGPGFRIPAEALGLPAGAPARRIADAFVARFGALWKVEPGAFSDALVREIRRDRQTGPRTVSIEYRQLVDGVPVLGATLGAHVDEQSSELVAVTGHFVPAHGISTRARVTEAEAQRAAEEAVPGRTSAPRLALDEQHGRLALVWVVDVVSDAGELERVLVDAGPRSGSAAPAIVARRPLGRAALDRQHWDLRSRTDLSVATCQKWQLGWPPSGCSASCAPCTTDPRRCDECACIAAGDPADCETAIWRYGESSGCAPDGVPVGEGACNPDALVCWDQSQAAYDYWQTRFGRDSWDDAGAPMWTKSRWNSAFAAGMATVWDRDLDGVPELQWVSILTGAANPWLLGHELGHVLQFGTHPDDGTDESLYGTYGASLESLADVHGHRYVDNPLPSACTGTDLTHYTELWTASGTFYAQTNKGIGNCQAWLMAQESFGSWWHKGVTTTPTAPDVFDQIWYRALDVYEQSGDGYFEWWDHLVSAAFDLYDWSPPMFAAGSSTDAVGNWTTFQSIGGEPRADERVAAVSWDGAPSGPCVFYRPRWDASRIMWQCYTGNIWFQPQPFNDPAVDPAASEPTAAYRYESGKIYAYVLWRGTDDRIHYRRFDLDGFVIGSPADLGPSHLSAGPVAAAGTWETAFVDRLVVVYHPLAHPTWLYATHLGSTSAPTDLGGSFDSDAPPAMAAYPYPGRVYVVRPDFSPSRRLGYRSYSVSGGWTVKRDLTALYAGDPGIDESVVRTDRGVALGEYGRSDPRLRMTFVTLPASGGARELWYATLEERVVGELERQRYRAVPLAAVTPFTSSQAGGLAEDRWGFPLWHFWAQGPVAGKPELGHARTHSD